MTPKEAITEVFWNAYIGLPKRLRNILVRRIIVSETISEDWLDHILIERAKRERGQDITLAEYIKKHPRRY